MEELFSNSNLGYIIVFVLFILPRLLKLLRRTRAKKTSPPETKKPQKDPVLVLDEEDFDADDISSPEEPVPLPEFNDLVVRVEKAQLHASEISGRAEMYGGSVEQLKFTVESAAVRPLRAMAGALKRRVETGELFTVDDVRHIDGNLKRLTQLTKRLEFMLDRRATPQFTDILRVLDRTAEGCLFPYLAHARRLDLDYKTRHAMVVLGEAGNDFAHLFSATNLAPVVVDEKLAQQPFAWVHIPSDVALDVFHSTAGLARKVMSDSRVLPVPVSLSQYSDPRSFTAGLMNGWQPRIFADANAALLLGPAFAAGLANWMSTASESDRIRTIVLNDPFHAACPPLYVRMFVALSVLSYMGLEDDGKQRFQDWNDRVGDPSEFIIVGDDGNTGAVPANTVLDAVAHFIDSLMRQPIDALGGYPLSEIPRLRCGSSRVAEMQRIAGRFLDGEPVNASVISIIGAAQLAVEQSSTMEARVSKAAFKSLSGEVVADRQPALISTAPMSIKEVFGTKKSLARAIAAGATLAPRTSRGGRRL